jgi:hypothetical protein
VTLTTVFGLRGGMADDVVDLGEDLRVELGAVAARDEQGLDAAVAGGVGERSEIGEGVAGAGELVVAGGDGGGPLLRCVR